MIKPFYESLGLLTFQYKGLFGSEHLEISCLEQCGILQMLPLTCLGAVGIWSSRLIRILYGISVIQNATFINSLELKREFKILVGQDLQQCHEFPIKKFLVRNACNQT